MPSFNLPRQLWEKLRSSLWFVPALIVFTAVALGLALVEADGIFGETLEARWPRLFAAGAEGARALLAAIAGSMITVAGVAFSITIVALTLASSQYTSRILRNFMRDRANQVVLGVFTGIFAYCLVVLRTVRSTDEGRFVPDAAVLTAVLLALAGIGVLIFFIHHIASSLQASNIVRRAADDTLSAADRLFPEETAPPPDKMVPSTPATENRTWSTVTADSRGYVQDLDAEALLGLACEEHTILRMECAIGDFVIEGSPLVAYAGGAPSAALAKRIKNSVSIGRQRTIVQDPAFGILQITDVALKALSPGINDTTTALVCVDYLAAVLARIAGRAAPPQHHFHEGQLRLIARPATFEGLLASGIDPIRRAAAGNVAVYVRLFKALEMIAGGGLASDRRVALAAHAKIVAEEARRTIPSRHDLEVVQARAAHCLQALAGNEAPQG